MPRTWLSVKVELLGGRGQELWPWPGRLLAVGPSHTFADLADAINSAFARWDRSHLSLFTLADGRVVTDEETGIELTGSIGGPIVTALDIGSTRVARTVEPGDEFQYTFDLGDEWTHRCLVAQEKIDPVEVLGTPPAGPLPYWGWGTVPDQYGRRWADDDGDSSPPRRPRQPHPLERRRRDAEPVVSSVINRLTWRRAPGDDVLAEDLLARLRGEPLPGRVVPVDLDDDPDRWLWFDRTGSRDGWNDMAAFAGRQRDPVLRERLERAIEGKGAFRRFRDLLHEENLAEEWYVYAADRQLGRARLFLDDEGIRVG